MSKYGETLARAVDQRIHAPVADQTGMQGIAADDRSDGQTCEKLDDYTNWAYESGSSAAAGATVIVPTDNPATGRWVKQNTAVAKATSTADGLLPATGPGTALTDAPSSVAVTGGRWYVMPAATLSATRAFTLATTGAAAGDQIEVTRLDATANTMTFVNGGVGAGTMLTMPASKVNFAKFYFDGTNWSLRAVGTQ